MYPYGQALANRYQQNYTIVVNVASFQPACKYATQIWLFIFICYKYAASTNALNFLIQYHTSVLMSYSDIAPNEKLDQSHSVKCESTDAYQIEFSITISERLLSYMMQLQLLLEQWYPCIHSTQLNFKRRSDENPTALVRREPYIALRSMTIRVGWGSGTIQPNTLPSFRHHERLLCERRE
jgi:hypothetical protein